jgi:hypothetical protein
MQHKINSAGLVSSGAGENMQQTDIMRKAQEFSDPNHIEIVSNI